MRWWLLALCAMMPAEANAACQVRTIGETAGKFMPALRALLAADETPDPKWAGVEDGVTILTFPGSQVGMRLVEKDDRLAEVGTDIVGPINDRDKETFVTVSGAMISHLSDVSEQRVKDDIHAGLHAHPGPGNFLLRWGGTAASVTRSDQGMVARIGKMDCD